MTIATITLGRPNSGSPEDMLLWAEQLVGQLETYLASTLGPHGQPFAVSNPTVNRSLNVSTATLSQVTQVLGTLISDLKVGSQIA